MVDPAYTAMMHEVRNLTDSLRHFGSLEAAMRLRALAELSSKVGTNALLALVASVYERNDEA